MNRAFLRFEQHELLPAHREQARRYLDHQEFQDFYIYHKRPPDERNLNNIESHDFYIYHKRPPHGSIRIMNAQSKMGSPKSPHESQSKAAPPERDRPTPRGKGQSSEKPQCSDFVRRTPPPGAQQGTGPTMPGSPPQLPTGGTTTMAAGTSSTTATAGTPSTTAAGTSSSTAAAGASTTTAWTSSTTAAGASTTNAAAAIVPVQAQTAPGPQKDGPVYADAPKTRTTSKDCDTDEMKSYVYATLKYRLDTPDAVTTEKIK